MKAIQRTEYDRRVPTCFYGVFQNETVRHQNDIAFASVPGKETKDLCVKTKQYAVANVVDAVVNTCRGELALDQTRGLPYFESAFGNNGDITDWTAWAAKAIRETNGVKAVRNFDATVEKVGKRTVLNYTSTIETEWGEIEADDSNAQIYYSDSYEFPKDESLTKFIVLVKSTALLYLRVTMVDDTDVKTGYVYISDGERIEISRELYEEYSAGTGSVVVLKRFTKPGRYIVAIDSAFKAFRTGRDDDDAESKNLTRRALSWGDSITSADYAYYGCFANWDNALPYSLPVWGKNVASAVGTYMGASKIAAPDIVEWNDGTTDVTDCYNGCENIGNSFEIGSYYNLRDFIVSINAAIDFYDEELESMGKSGFGSSNPKISLTTGTMREFVAMYNTIRSALIAVETELQISTSEAYLTDTAEELRIKFNTLVEEY